MAALAAPWPHFWGGNVVLPGGSKSLADALEIRDAWAKERDQLEARGNTARNGRAGAIRIERREVVVFFD